MEITSEQPRLSDTEMIMQHLDISEMQIKELRALKQLLKRYADQECKHWIDLLKQEVENSRAEIKETVSYRSFLLDNYGPFTKNKVVSGEEDSRELVRKILESKDHQIARLKAIAEESVTSLGEIAMIYNNVEALQIAQKILKIINH